MKDSLRLFNLYFSKYKTPLIAYGSLGVAQGLLLIPIPFLLKYLVDQSSNNDWSNLTLIVGSLLGISALSISFMLISRIGLVKTVKKKIEELRTELAQRIISMPHRGQWQEYESQLKNIVIDDTEKLDIAATVGFGQVLPACIGGILMAAALFVISPLLFIITCVVFPIIFIILIHFKRRLQNAHEIFRQSLFSMEKSVRFIISAWELIKTQTAEDAEKEKQKHTFSDMRRVSQSLANLHIYLQATQESIGLIFGILLLAIGFYFVSIERLTTGEVISFFAGFSLLRSQLANILNGWPHIIYFAASLRHIDQILKLHHTTPYQGKRKHLLKGEISLRDVSFSISNTTVLDAVSVTFTPESFSVITGKNGDGKTTLLLALLGLVSPDSGKVFVDGIDLITLDIHEYRRQIAVVSQHPLFIDSTVKENREYGLHHDIAAPHLADSDFHIEETRLVSSLSGGEKQKLMIQRALKRNPKVLLLDEPTNHLDAQAFESLLDFLANISRKITVICITHEPRVIGQADNHFHLTKDRLKHEERNV
ncbi:MAG: ABC transporter ATP-binding protein [Candidatus Andersenbacteria bacterium]